MKRLYLFFIMCVFVQVSNSQQTVDLGLSVKWATCNVGASSPEDYGDYYAWGETETKDDYCIENYKWRKGSDGTFTKYCTKSSYGTVDNKTVLEPADDVAHVKWGENWRMPTLEEWKELCDKAICTWTWTTQNGTKGYKVTSKSNGNYIFLPAAGYRIRNSLRIIRSSLRSTGSFGYCWSSSLGDGDDAYDLYFDSSYDGCCGDRRYFGRSVRPVCP